MAQIDISSLSLSANISTPVLPPHSRTTTRQQQQQQQQQQSRSKVHSSSSVSNTHPLKNNNNSSNSNQVHVRANKGENSNNTLGINGGHNVVRRMVSASASLGIGVGAGRPGSIIRRGGSVTSSDDGTVSEDSVEDYIQLFSGAGAAGGGLHVTSLPFTSARQQRTEPKPISGPKFTSDGAGRMKTPTVPTGGPSVRPIRIAAGASIRIDTDSSTSSSSGHTPIPYFLSGSQPLNVTGTGASIGGHTSIEGGNGGSAVGLLSTSVSSSTSSSSSSLSWVSSPSSKRNSGSGVNGSVGSPSSSIPTDDSGYGTSNLSISSPTTTSFPFNAPQPTLRAIKSASSGLSTAATAAAAAKQAEENRQSEEAARIRRKVADLEISNTSLLQINQTLEATVRKQAAKLQELEMRIQSTQFGGDLSMLAATDIAQDSNISPDNASVTTMATAMAMTTSTTTTPTPKPTTRPTSLVDPEAAIIIHEMTEADRQADLTFKRVCMAIDQMIFEAKQALDQSMKPAGMKVLSSFEMYEDDLDAAEQSFVDNEDDDDYGYDDEDDDFRMANLSVQDGNDSDID
ncbi:hypothetical protein BX616_000865 [Lobosporangium transversale]|nr:hypothetical protein BX616_000865 [Lobosporangium transversale]